MAKEGTLKQIVWIAAVVVIAAGGKVSVAAQSSTSGCGASLLSLSPCAAFVNASNAIPSASPPQGCCSALASLLQTTATCFCNLFSSVPTNPFPIPFAFPINQTRALTLPASCKITTPQCKAAGAPTNAPASSPDVTGSDAAATSPNTGTQSAPGPTSEAPSAASPSLPPLHSEAGALSTPSALMVSAGLILGSIIWGCA